MLIHRANFQHNYNTTDQRMKYVIKDIVTVFGYKNARWFKVKREGYDLEWERELVTTRIFIRILYIPE